MSITICLFYSILLHGKAFLLLLNMLKTLAMTSHFFVRDDMTWVWNYSCQIKNDEMSSSSIFRLSAKNWLFFFLKCVPTYMLSFCIDRINNYMNVVSSSLSVRNSNLHCLYYLNDTQFYIDGKVQTPCENTFPPKYYSRLNTCSWFCSEKKWYNCFKIDCLLNFLFIFHLEKTSYVK